MSVETDRQGGRQDRPVRVIEVFADVGCPFAHVGLRRFAARRAAAGVTHVVLRVRAWPLELVNAAPLDPQETAEEVDALRSQVAPDGFVAFDPETFPTTTLPAMDLEATAYGHGPAVGEAVSLALRDALFEQGLDVSASQVLADIASAAGISPPLDGARQQVVHDWQDGQRRGVTGSPHFFVGNEGYFCPFLNIDHVGDQLRITSDEHAFDRFLERCLGP